jgi:PadR family transcriptional regulator PadR
MTSSPSCFETAPSEPPQHEGEGKAPTSLTAPSNLDIGAMSSFERVKQMADSDVRLSGPTLKLLKLMLEEPTRKRSGAEISREAKIGSGTLYPLLLRLERAGWLLSEWEHIDPKEAGRPRRRFYRLSPVGYPKAREALAGFQFEGAVAWSI